MTEPSLTGKNAIVTGASSGMGAGIAIGLARAGARVLILGRNGERLSAVAARFPGSAPDPIVLQADITTDLGVEKVVKTASDSFSKVDILIHAAGVYEPIPFDETPLESFDRQWMINVRAPFALTRGLLGNFRNEGAIVFITSIAGLRAFRNSVAYCTTKGAEELLSKSLAVELAPRGIRVNAVAPGNVHTPMNAHLFAQPGFTEDMLAKTPAGRIGEVPDIVSCVVFLASDAARYIYGASMVVDGGWMAG